MFNLLKFYILGKVHLLSNVGWYTSTNIETNTLSLLRNLQITGLGNLSETVVWIVCVCTFVSCAITHCEFNKNYMFTSHHLRHIVSAAPEFHEFLWFYDIIINSIFTHLKSNTTLQVILFTSIFSEKIILLTWEYETLCSIPTIWLSLKHKPLLCKHTILIVTHTQILIYIEHKISPGPSIQVLLSYSFIIVSLLKSP